MNRTVARRTLFENDSDIRYFKARLAKEVRRGTIELHAFCLMTTHFHLLIRSPDGQLSEPMHRIQHSYVRRFNRSRGRDGPLFRGRFRSRLVDSIYYRRVLAIYIDDNPVDAGLVERPEDYPHGSARHYATSSIPRWLCSNWIASTFGVGADYLRKLHAIDRSTARFLVEGRICAVRPEDPLQHLLQAAPSGILQWLTETCRMADGTKPGVPVALPTVVLSALSEIEIRAPHWKVPTAKRTRCGWPILKAALLRSMSGLTWDEIGGIVNQSGGHLTRLHKLHGRLLREDAEYRRRAREVGARVMELMGVELGGGVG